MTNDNDLVVNIQLRLENLFDSKFTHLTSISPELRPLAEHSRLLLVSGKRFRPMFCYWGWKGVFDHWNQVSWGSPEDDQVLQAQVATIERIGVALELFHAAALVHDDIIDSSDTRRGQPSAHKRLSDLHRSSSWEGVADDFGRAGAILLGDLLLTWSQQEFYAAIRSAQHGDLAVELFDTMCTEVVGGQYLDVLEEHAWPSRVASEAHDQAVLINTYKSAKYSVEYPLLIGAAVAGASKQQLAGLSAYGLAVGQAFQLRDDVLGVFGDSAITGKPSGDDLREGKRTVLIALSREKLPPGPLHTLDELLGDPSLTDAQIAMLQSTVIASGALDSVEQRIEQDRQAAEETLRDVEISGGAKQALSALASAATSRRA